MTAFVALGAALCLLTAAWLTRPLWRGARALAVALSVFVGAVALAAYGVLGTPAALAPQAPAVATVAPPPANAQVEAMVARLAERLKTQPDDAPGWQMLARSYSVLGRHAQAAEAYARAARLGPADATTMADHAFALGMANGRRFGGEPTRLVEQALLAEPGNPKVLALAGTLAFERKDYALAVRHWERLAQVEPADSPFGARIRDSIAQAKALAGR